MTAIVLVFVIFIFLTNSNVYFSYAQFTVTTSAGNVLGTTAIGSVNNVSYRAFVNIPYAMPPIDNLRFKAPVAFATNNTGNINIRIGAVVCPQMMGPAPAGTDDCLILNVYTPLITDPLVTYPVMVWIHGGAFSQGASSWYQPEFLVAESVILVTVNYRLGALGFLSLGNDDAPGNAGLKDQALALTWVNKEISSFNGDPTRITLFGESAGAASVHHHMLSKYSSGLFQRAIIQSGNALRNWTYLESGFENRAKTFAQKLNCVQNNEVVFSCLQNASVNDIVSNQQLFSDIEATIRAYFLTFTAVKERNPIGAFHSESISDLTKTIANPVPIIMGTNKDEGLLLIRQSNIFFNNFFDNLRYFIPLKVRSSLDESEITNRIGRLMTKYFPSKIPPSIYNYQGFVQLYTDQLFATSTLEAAQILLAQNSKPSVYLYRFDYEGDYGLTSADARRYGIAGVNHGDDLGYLFYIPGLATQTYSATSQSYSVLRKMVAMWTTFAATGNPIPLVMNSTSPLYDVSWYPITSSNSSYLSITATPTMVNANFSSTETILIWDEISHSSSFHLRATFLLIYVSFVVTKVFAEV